MRRILEKMGNKQEENTTTMCDSSSVIKLSKNLVMHGRSKHIEVQFHFLRDLVKDGTIKDQAADIMTKPVKLADFLKLPQIMGVCEVSDKLNT